MSAEHDLAESLATKNHRNYVDVLGVRVDAQPFDSAIDRLLKMVETQNPGYVCITSVHGIIEAQKDPELMSVFERAAMVTADGMPLVWSGRYAGFDDAERVCGPDLMLEIARRSVALGYGHYFYGGLPGVAEQLEESLSAQFPGMETVGRYSPPFKVPTDADVIADCEVINESGADIVWVGISTPKQDKWMARARPHLKAPLLIGVGAAFDVHSGRTPQAPKFLQRIGLEWSYRMAKEPRRLAPRYLSSNPAFIAKILQTRPQPIEL